MKLALLLLTCAALTINAFDIRPQATISHRSGNDNSGNLKLPLPSFKVVTENETIYETVTTTVLGTEWQTTRFTPMITSTHLNVTEITTKHDVPQLTPEVVINTVTSTISPTRDSYQTSTVLRASTVKHLLTNVLTTTALSVLTYSNTLKEVSVETLLHPSTATVTVYPTVTHTDVSTSISTSTHTKLSPSTRVPKSETITVTSTKVDVKTETQNIMLTATRTLILPEIVQRDITTVLTRTIDHLVDHTRMYTFNQTAYSVADNAITPTYVTSTSYVHVPLIEVVESTKKAVSTVPVTSSYMFVTSVTRTLSAEVTSSPVAVVTSFTVRSEVATTVTERP